MNRAFSVTDMVNTALFTLPRSLNFSGINWEGNHQVWKPVRIEGQGFQKSFPIPTQVTFSGVITGSSYSDLRTAVQTIVLGFGLTNKRLWINNDRYIIVRFLEYTLRPIGNTRECFIGMDISLQMMDYRIFDIDGLVYVVE